MEDYKEEIRILLQKHYWNVGQEHKKIQRTTSQILSEVRGVIPKHPIDEHDIYDIMKELHFEQVQVILYEEKCITEEDEKRGIKPEHDKIEVGRHFVWNLYEK